jgi:hypothetical protein
MLRVLLLSMPLLLSACSDADTPVTRAVSEPGHGRVSVAVEPNPIVAKRISDDLIGLPFDVVVTETAGVPVDVQKLVLNVSLAGASVYSLTFTAEDLRKAGQSTTVPGSGSVRFAFHPKTRKDDRILGSASGEVTVVAVDGTSALALAATGVSVR